MTARDIAEQRTADAFAQRERIEHGNRCADLVGRETWVEPEPSAPATTAKGGQS